MSSCERDVQCLLRVLFCIAYNLTILFGGVFFHSCLETSCKNGCTMPTSVQPTEAAKGLVSSKIWPCWQLAL